MFFSQIYVNLDFFFSLFFSCTPIFCVRIFFFSVTVLRHPFNIKPSFAPGVMLPRKEDGLATFSRVGLILGKVMMTLRKFYYVQTHRQQQKGQIDWPVCFSVHVCPVFSPWVLMWIPNHIKPAFSKVLFKKDNMSLLKVHPGNTGYWLVLRAENLHGSSCTRKRCFMCVTAVAESFLGCDPAQTEAERCNSDQG